MQEKQSLLQQINDARAALSHGSEAIASGVDKLAAVSSQRVAAASSLGALTGEESTVKLQLDNSQQEVASLRDILASLTTDKYVIVDILLSHCLIVSSAMYIYVCMMYICKLALGTSYNPK